MAPGAPRRHPGPQKGAKYAKTLRKQAEFEALIQLVKEDLKAMVSAQISATKGTNYLLVRHEDGTFSHPDNLEDIDRIDYAPRPLQREVHKAL